MSAERDFPPLLAYASDMADVTSLAQAKRRRRAFKLRERIKRLEALLAKRKAEMLQLDTDGLPMALYWVSFVEASGRAVDIVVRANDPDAAFVAAARLLDDPPGDPMTFEVPSALWHGPIGVMLDDEQIQAVARVADDGDSDVPANSCPDSAAERW